MAIHKRDSVTFGGRGPITIGVYTVRVIEAKKGKSKAGNDMAVIRVEIVAPEEIEVLGERQSIAGRQHTYYAVLDDQNQYGTGKLIKALERAGFEFAQFNEENELDDDKLNLLNGFCFDVKMDSKEHVVRHAVTQEEKAAGIKEGRPVLDAAGKQVTLGWDIISDLSDVHGPASVEVANRPY